MRYDQVQFEQTQAVSALRENNGAMADSLLREDAYRAMASNRTPEGAYNELSRLVHGVTSAQEREMMLTGQSPGMQLRFTPGVDELGRRTNTYHVDRWTGFGWQQGDALFSIPEMRPGHGGQRAEPMAYRPESMPYRPEPMAYRPEPMAYRPDVMSGPLHYRPGYLQVANPYTYHPYVAVPTWPIAFRAPQISLRLGLGFSIS